MHKRVNYMTKKTLLLSEVFPPMHGGSGRWMWELYSRLPHENYIIAAGKSKGYQAFDKLTSAQITRIDMKTTNWSNWAIFTFRGLYFYIANFIRILKLIRKNNIDEIHCARCIPEGVIAYFCHKLFNIPYTCFIHGEDLTNAGKSRQFRFLVNKVLKHASFLICNSENSRRILTDEWLIDKKKSEVLHPGVDSSKFIPAAENKEIKQKFNWLDRKVILTVSRLEARKGQDMLIRALPAIITQTPNVLYALIGGGDEKEKLNELAKSLNVSNNIMFMSELSDTEMIMCYQQCDLFALPNRTIDDNIEGFGMVLVEAQSCGKPVIGGDSGGTPETMIQGETGYVVNCHTPDLLAEKINELLSDPKRLNTMGIQAREHVMNSLDWIPHVAKAQKIFLNRGK